MMPSKLAIMLLGLLGVSCRACDSPAVATLTTATGDVRRDHAQSRNTWVAANVKDEFMMGDGLRTGTHAKASLTVFPDTVMDVRPASIVRFTEHRPDQRSRVLLEAGEVEVETAEREIEILTEIGVARLYGRTRARFRANGPQVHFDVDVGKVEVVSEQDRKTVLAGQSVQLAVGKVVLEREEPPGTPEQPEPTPATEALATEVSEGARTWLLPQSTSDIAHSFVLRPGESATIHDPSPPTELVLPLSNCAGRAELEVSTRTDEVRATRTGRAALKLDAGAYAYTVRCQSAAGKPYTQRGRLEVRRDAGTRRLPRKAPQVSVDADGRRYSVRYQNRLPRVTFAWPHAPVAAGYKLALRSRHGQRDHVLKKPTVSLPAAALPEGNYHFRFEAQGGRRSPESVLSITFDNTARAAYLMTPKPGSPLHIGNLAVAGVALRNSRVEIQAQDVRVAADGRFRATLPALALGEALVVRVHHKQSGIHYYLRE